MKLLETTVTGVTGLAAGMRQPCEACALSKSVRVPNKGAPERIKRRLQRMYTDF
jgi:hypothetical protein